MKIERMFEKRTFEIECHEHAAVLTADANEIRFVSKQTCAYTCPICGDTHIVRFSRIHQVDHYRNNVDLTDPMLPINILKAAAKETAKMVKDVRKLKKHFKDMKPDTRSSVKRKDLDENITISTKPAEQSPADMLPLDPPENLPDELKNQN